MFAILHSVLQFVLRHIGEADRGGFAITIFGWEISSVPGFNVVFYRNGRYWYLNSTSFDDIPF